MSILAVLFVFFFDLVLVAGFRVFHKQLSDRFYKRCAIAFSFEALSTLILFLLPFEEWRYFSFTLLFDLQCIKGLMLWSAIRSLDSPTSHKWWVPVVFVGYFLLLLAADLLGLGQFVVSQIAITLPLIFNLMPAWTLYRSQWISWKSYQLLLGCILLSQILFAAAVQMGDLDTEWTALLYYLNVVSNVFVGLSAMVIGMKRLHARLEKALKTIVSMRNQTEAIVKASMDSILITDIEGRILFANPVAKSFFIGGAKEHPNLFENEFHSEAEDEESFSLESINRALNLNNNAFVKYQCMMEHQTQGRIPVEFTVVPILNDEGKLLSFYIRDLREQRQNEVAIVQERDRTKQLNKQLCVALEQAKHMTEKAEQANASKNDFLGVMSHELRTPLSAIIGMASMMEQEPLTAQQRQSAASINYCGQSLLLIIGDILNYSRIEAGHVELLKKPFSLRQNLQQILTLVRDQCNHKKLRLYAVLHPRLPLEIVGDEGKIRQILTNLVNNAVKFTEKGHVSINLRVLTTDQKHLSQLEITVADTGIGINKEQKDRLFEAFYQADCSTSRKYQGTGLGLAISKRLIKAMGGEIQVDSIPGKGSTFTALIPCSHVDADSSDVFNFEWNVIYVDPDESGLSWFKTNLSAYGVEVKCYSSVENFLQGESAKRLSKTICLIDQQALLKLDEEPQVMGKFKRLQARVPVVFALHQVTDVLQEFKYSIAKPFLIEQFMEKAATIPLEWNQKDIATEEIPSAILQFEPLQINVLVAEDHPINCKLAKLYLDNLGCTNRIVHDGNEALAALEEEAFDVVLMDLHMPALDGLEATRRLIKLHEGKDRPRIIALTADNSKNEKEVALEAGMDEFLLKPIKIEKLREVLIKQMKVLTRNKLRQ